MKKICSFILLLFLSYGNAQIIDFLKDKVKDKTASLVGQKLMNSITTEAITTNFTDCNKIDVKNVDLGKNAKFTNLCNATFSQAEGYILKPGYYILDVKSFCLKAGTYAPGKGDGYLYAPLAGPRKDIINSLVKNWYLHPEISQQNVQALVWGVIAKSSFKNLGPELQLVATKLLSKNELLQLSKMGLDFLPESMMSKAKASLPKPIQMALEAENKIRNFFNSSSSNYADLERLAMLGGLNPETSEISYGTWGLHPKGYWVSYQPRGYKEMSVKIFVPETLATASFNPSDDVAVPANTGSQRLMVSDVLNCR